MIYIGSFLISTLFMCISEIFKKRNYFVALLSVFLGIVSISILNGVRDLNIGTDMLVYGNQCFYLAVNSQTINDYFKLTYSVFNLNIEYGYQIFNYFVSRFTHNIHWYYFWLGILTNGLMYYGISIFRKEINLPVSWLVYLLMFYGNTLNIMRQSIAVTVLFLGVAYYIKKEKLFISSILIIVAVLFHKSAIVGFMILWLYIFLKKRTNSLKLHIKILLSAFLGMVFSTNILMLMSELGLLDNKLEQYVTFNSRQSEVTIFTIGMRAPFVIYWTLFYKKNIEGKLLPSFLFLLVILDFIALPLREIDITISRITLYIAIFKIVAFPLMLRSTTKRYFKMFAFFVLLLFLLISWYFQFVVNGNGEIYPFQSNILQRIF